MIRAPKKFYLFISVIALLCAIVPFTYVVNFGHLSISDRPELWGAFGDFIGGILNPLLSFAAFSGLLLTLFLQREQLKQNEQELDLTRQELSLSTAELRRSADAQNVQIETSKLQNFESTFFSLLDRFEVQCAHIVRVYINEDVESSNNVKYISTSEKDLRYCGFEHLRYELYKHQEYYSSEQYAGRDGKRCDSKEAYEGLMFNAPYRIVFESYFRHLKFIIDFISESEAEDKRKYYRILFSELTNGEVVHIFYQAIYGEHLEGVKEIIELHSLFEYIGYQGLMDGYLDLKQYEFSAYGNNKSIRVNFANMYAEDGVVIN